MVGAYGGHGGGDERLSADFGFLYRNENPSLACTSILIPLQDIFLYILLINQEKTAEYRLKLIINYSRQNAVGMNNSYGIFTLPN